MGERGACACHAAWPTLMVLMRLVMVAGTCGATQTRKQAASGSEASKTQSTAQHSTVPKEEPKALPEGAQ